MDTSTASLMADKLWDCPLIAVQKVGDGLACTKELVKFLKRRAGAEEELAKSIRRMCLTEAAIGGAIGERVGANKILGSNKLLGGSSELLDSLNESAGSVQNAWASLVYATKTTANAHGEVADAIISELVLPLEDFCRDADIRYKKLAADGKHLDRLLSDVSGAVAKAQETYFASCCDQSDRSDASVMRLSTNPLQPKTGRPEATKKEEYDLVVAKSNAEQLRIKDDDALNGVLARLEALERERVERTKDAMRRFVIMTTSQLPLAIGQPTAELSLAIDSIDIDADVDTFCSKRSTGSVCGSLVATEYDPVRDIPPNLKSLGQLIASGGGPIKCGWLQKEGHLVKNWKRRWCVLWPLNFKAEAVSGPSLFYFDDNETTSLPKGTLQIFGSNIGTPKKPRKGYPWLIRIDCVHGIGEAEDGGKHDKLVLAAETAEEREAWLEALCNASNGEAVQRCISFGVTLADIMSDQAKRCPLSECSVPIFFLDVLHHMEQMGALSTEGLFRVPGDNDDVQELKSRYELDELLSTATLDQAISDNTSATTVASAFDVHVWASFAKAWLRALKDPVVVDSCYDEAICIGEQSDSESTSAAVVSGIAALLERLPALHKRVVFQLCEFLSRVDPVASKMTPENLAIVFAPCILRHADLHVALANSRHEIAFTKLLIEYGTRAGLQIGCTSQQRAYEQHVELRTRTEGAASCEPNPLAVAEEGIPPTS